MMSRWLVRTLIAAAALAPPALAIADAPETVMITLRAKPGAERALADVIARHYDTARRMSLLKADAPHVTLRSVDQDDKQYFVEIFTWRDADTPDHAPKEILALWQEMNALVEARNGQQGLSIVSMTPVTPEK
jgi:hypothetical protein